MSAPKINKDLYIGDTGKTLNNIVNNVNSLNSSSHSRELVKEVVLSSPSSIMEITGLDIIRDGGIYDIIVEEFSTTNTSSGHYLQLNGMGSGYNGRHRYIWDADYSQWVNTIHSVCLAFTNGWSMGTPIFYTVGTLIFFNKDWMYFQSRGGTTTYDENRFVDVQCDTYVVNKNISNITSLRVICTDGDKIGVGSRMRIYKRV